MEDFRQSIDPEPDINAVGDDLDTFHQQLDDASLFGGEEFVPERVEAVEHIPYIYANRDQARDDRQQQETLLDTLDAAPGQLRRDACGLWIIAGRRGTIQTWGDGKSWVLYVRCRSRQHWTFTKRRLAFMTVTQDGDEEGCLRLDRLPTPQEAVVIRDVLGLRKRVAYAPDALERKRASMAKAGLAREPARASAPDLTTPDEVERHFPAEGGSAVERRGDGAGGTLIAAGVNGRFLAQGNAPREGMQSLPADHADPDAGHAPEPAGRRQVEAMAAYGIPEADIARVMEIDPKTLRRHYRTELDTGHIKANSRMAENLYRKAMGDGPQAVTATIFWLKTRAKWKETTINEVSITSNPLADLMRDIAERGWRIHDRPPAEIEGSVGPDSSRRLQLVANGGGSSRGPGREGY